MLESNSDDVRRVRLLGNLSPGPTFSWVNDLDQGLEKVPFPFLTYMRVNIIFLFLVFSFLVSMVAEKVKNQEEKKIKWEAEEKGETSNKRTQQLTSSTHVHSENFRVEQGN